MVSLELETRQMPPGSRPGKTPRFTRLLLALLFAASAIVGHAQAQRTVFAHYMLTNQDYLAEDGANQEAKIAAYSKEIRQAQALGIDGFALNAGGWLREPHYIRYAAEMFEAAVRLHSGFRLMFSADFCCGNGAADAEDMMRRFAGNPRYAQVYFQQDGRFVLTTFAGDKLGADAWRRIREDLLTGAHPSTAAEPGVLPELSAPPANAPLPVFLVPAFFWGGELPQKNAIQQGFDQWRSVIDGSFFWGIAGVPGSGDALDQLPGSEAYASVVHGGGKLYMAPICLQFWGSNANRYYEYSGGEGMRRMWMDAMEVTHPQWVEIITWNDFVEGSYISPIDDPNRYGAAADVGAAGVPPGTLGHFHSHAGAAALTRFYIEWYKTGREPAIRQDAVYWFYRTQSAGYDAGAPQVAHKYGPVADRVYVTANLTAPATLRVRIGEKTSSLELPAGSTDVSVPFAPGATPEFTLLRGRHTLLQGSGSDPIQAHPAYNNYYYSTGYLETGMAGSALSAIGK